MKRTEFKKIDMKLVKEIISKKGFYYFHWTGFMKDFAVQTT